MQMFDEIQICMFEIICATDTFVLHLLNFVAQYTSVDCCRGRKVHGGDGGGAPLKSDGSLNFGFFDIIMIRFEFSTLPGRRIGWEGYIM